MTGKFVRLGEQANTLGRRVEVIFNDTDMRSRRLARLAPLGDKRAVPPLKPPGSPTWVRKTAPMGRFSAKPQGLVCSHPPPW